MYMIIFYVPPTHLEEVKDALFSKGAGRYRNYDNCCYQVKGEGQFRPLKGSDPYIGTEGQVEKVEEYRVEMVCDDSELKDVVQELLRVHPYEEPAYGYIRMEHDSIT